MFKLKNHIPALLLFSSFSSHAIVNTESSFQSYLQEGLHGEFGFSFKGSSGNNQSSQLAFNTGLGWKNKNNISMLMIGRDFGKSNQTKNIDNSFIYLKHIQQIHQGYHLSIFAQREQDYFRDIKSRNIAGIGIRKTLTPDHIIELSLMNEGIDSTAQGERSRNTNRFNLLWYLSWALDEKIQLKNTLYYQPKINDFSDKQAINQANLTFNMTANFSIEIYHKFTHFTVPIGDSASTDNNYGTSFNYKF